MSEQLREQVSAFIDGELPASETELLLKRLMRDAAMRESFGRYALVGECLRGGSRSRLSQGFATRVKSCIEAESPLAAAPGRPPRVGAWWRPFAGVAVAAGVAAVAVVALQQRAEAPTVVALQPAAAAHTTVAPVKDPGVVPGVAGGGLHAASLPEPRSYVVPPAVSDGPSALPATLFTNYVFAHSQFSTGLGHVLPNLLSDGDGVGEAANEVVDPARSRGAFGVAESTDIRVAP